LLICFAGFNFIYMNRLMLKYIALSGLAFCTISLSGPTAHAQQIFEIQPLNFGTFAISDNNSSHTLRIDFNGNITADPEVIIETNPVRGEYLLTGQDPLRQFDVTVTDGTLTLGDSGVGNTITVDTYTTNNPTTDGSGEATVYIGATLRTSGNSSIYTSGIFLDSGVELTVDYQ
jgi:hypothetical protein